MNQKKQSFDLLDFINSTVITEPKGPKATKNKKQQKIENHQPSWMYRNE